MVGPNRAPDRYRSAELGQCLAYDSLIKCLVEDIGKLGDYLRRDALGANSPAQTLIS
jgi:hypothetical protein